MEKKINKISVFVNKKNSSEPNDSFTVPISRFCKVRKLQGKIKKLQGIRMMDQKLSLSSPSQQQQQHQRELLPNEVLNTLLPSDQNELNLSLTVVVAGEAAAAATTVSNQKNDEVVSKRHFKFLLKGLPVVVPVVVPEVEPSAAAAAEAAPAPAAAAANATSDPTVNNDSDNFETSKKEVPSTKKNDDEDSSKEDKLVTIVKLSFVQQHRRFPFEHQAGQASYERLTDLCTQFFGVKNVHRMVLSYRDEDGDMVQLSTDAELAYALAHHAQNTPFHPKQGVLKLAFSVKQSKKEQQQQQEPQEVAEEVNVAPIASASASAASGVSNVSCGSQRTPLLKDGDVIVLQTQRETIDGGATTVNLAFCCNEEKLFAARPFPNGEPRKNSLWVVEKAEPKKNQKNGKFESSSLKPVDDGEGEVFFLSSKALVQDHQKKQKKDEKKSMKKNHLRVLPSGRVDHEGGRGAWARFSIKVQPDGRVTLRSVGRSLRRQENNYLGIINNNQKKPFFAVVGDLKEDADDTKFELKLVA